MSFFHSILHILFLVSRLCQLVGILRYIETFDMCSCSFTLIDASEKKYQPVNLILLENSAGKTMEILSTY